MTEREREICARIRAIREHVKWSQTVFAREIGVTRYKLVSIEFGHTPLRYKLASQIIKKFDISAKWLATGAGEMQPYTGIIGAAAGPDGFKENDLLTKVYDLKQASFDPSDYLKLNPRKMPSDFNFKEWVCDFLWIYCFHSKFKDQSASWEFSEKLLEFLKGERGRMVRAGRIEPRLSIKSGVNPLYSAIQNFGPELENTPKTHLTDAETVGKLGDVKPQMPDFLERLKKAAAAPGQKTALANFLKVPLASVSRWLSGEREPGGEITLKLLKWVELQERQK